MSQRMHLTKRRALGAARHLQRATGLDRVLAALPPSRLGNELRRLCPQNTDYPLGTVRACRRDGLRLFVDLHDYVDWWLYFQLHEPARSLLFHQAREGATVVDVGGNVGEVALRLAQRVGSDGRVLTFEPWPENQRRLQRNLDANPQLAARVTHLPLALGATAGELHLNLPVRSNRGGVRFAPEGTEGAVVTVAVERLDESLREHGNPDVSLIKIDVEGYELQVLRGAAATIGRCRPVIFVEVNDQHLRAAGDSAGALVSWLTAMGYELRLAQGGQAVRSAADLPAHGDLLCRPC